MMKHTAGVLKQLSAGRKGTRVLRDHQNFEVIIDALIPDNATEEHMLRSIGEILGLQWKQIDRAQKRNLANDGTTGAFSRATKVTRKQRKDYRGWGRRIAIDYWHKATRLDTNLGKKKRNREVNPVTQEVSSLTTIWPGSLPTARFIAASPLAGLLP